MADLVEEPETVMIMRDQAITGVDLVALAVRNRENFLGAMEVF